MLGGELLAWERGGGTARQAGFPSQNGDQVQIPAVPLTGCVTLGQPPNVSIVGMIIVTAWATVERVDGDCACGTGHGGGHAVSPRRTVTDGGPYGLAPQPWLCAARTPGQLGGCQGAVTRTVRKISDSSQNTLGLDEYLLVRVWQSPPCSLGTGLGGSEAPNVLYRGRGGPWVGHAHAHLLRWVEGPCWRGW